MLFVESYKVKPEHRVHLARIDPGQTADFHNKTEIKKRIARQAKRLRELQYLLYAESRRSLLICLQAPDAGGKDGIIRHVFGCMNPQGCRVQSFKVPTPYEASHDFLWRAHRATPAMGEVIIFNRSHYEDVLPPRVHHLIPESEWRRRYDAINDFERNLSDNGTLILKFYLHISREEQLRRFGKRLQDSARHWKISEADYRERAFWDDYQQAYDDMLNRCSTPHAPWYVIPANHKWFRNLLVSIIVVQQLEELNMRMPEASVDIEEIRRKFHHEKETNLSSGQAYAGDGD